jgi:glutathione S-transferase
MITLYYSPGTASLAPHFLLEELGVPYELVLVDTTQQEHQKAAYLSLNPKGKLPFLVDGDLHLSESAAICLYLCERYGKETWSPALASPERAHLYQWMLYLSNTLQAELLTYFYPHRLAAEEATSETIKQHAEQRLGEMLSYIDRNFAQSGHRYLLGSEMSVADLFLFMLCRWTRHLKKSAKTYPHLAPYLIRMCQRDSILRSFAEENIEAPYY